MKKVLLVTAGSIHPPHGGRTAVHQALARLEGFSFQHVRSLERVPGDLDSFAALVLYFHQKTITAPALARLDSFVKKGGGILALHSATASFKNEPHYFEIIGGRFVRHGAVEDFVIRPVKSDIFAGIGEFTIKDELYLHELQPGIEVHFVAQHEGQAVPVVWTYHYGSGKVCYAVPGHTTESMKHPAVQEILQRGLMWVSA